MALHPAIGTNRYCGPAALAILTGMDTDECAMLLRCASGKRAIRRIHERHLLHVLTEQHVSHCEIQRGTSLDPTQSVGLTLTRWMDSVPSARYLVIITGHFVVVDTDDGEVCDNATVYPLHISKYRQASKHVRRAWRIQ